MDNSRILPGADLNGQHAVPVRGQPAPADDELGLLNNPAQLVAGNLVSCRFRFMHFNIYIKQ